MRGWNAACHASARNGFDVGIVREKTWEIAMFKETIILTCATIGELHAWMTLPDHFPEFALPDRLRAIARRAAALLMLDGDLRRAQC